MKNVIADVAAFHRTTGVPIKDTPEWPDPERVALRMRLTKEEYTEIQMAVFERDIVGVADGIADLIYILIGNALEFGIPLDRVWDAVHRANMAKVDPVTGMVRRREDGKVLKPEGWQPPDIAGVLGVKPT